MEDVKKCSKCKEEIKTDANKCKHCNADQRSWSNKYKSLFRNIAISSFVVIIIIISMSIGSELGNTINKNNSENYFPNAEYKNSNNGDVAAVCAQNEIKTMLKSPSSAKFPWGLTSSLISGNKYIVSNYVDFQNSFGAMIRTNYICDVVVNNPKSFDCDASCIIE